MTNENGDTPYDPADMFTRLWTDFASTMAKAGTAFDPEKPPPDAARAMRDATMSAMNEHAQQFMRSPEFLAMLKQSLDASIAMRKQLNDFLAKAQYEFQSASRQDADQLMETIQHLETRIASGLDRLGQHIDRLDARLDKLEGAGKRASATRRAAAPPKPTHVTRTKATKKAAKKKAKKRAS